MYVIPSEKFERQFRKIKDGIVRERILKNLNKLIILPEAGKPLRHDRKGCRRLVIKPFRIIYKIEKDIIKIICFDHRGKVY